LKRTETVLGDPISGGVSKNNLNRAGRFFADDMHGDEFADYQTGRF
jgi:hypothetical protein